MNRIRLAGQLLRAYRERAGLSFNLAAEKLGCSLTLLSFIENGTRSLARKVTYQAVQALYGLSEAEVRQLQLLYGDKQLDLGGDARAAWLLFAGIADAWEARPESFSLADAEELLGAGMALFQAHPAELHEIYTRLCLALEDYPRAREHAERALADWRPDSFVSLEGLYNNLGEVCFREGQQVEARLQQQILAGQLASLATGSPPAGPDEALRQQTLSLYGQARAHFLQALARAPGYERGAYQLGLIHYNLAVLSPAPAELYTQAIDWLGRVLSARGGALNPERLERRRKALCFAILARSGLGDAATAGLLLDALISLRPADGFAHYLEAIVRLRQDEPEAALAALGRAGASDPVWLGEAGTEIEFYPLRLYLQRQGSSLEAWLAQAEPSTATCSQGDENDEKI